VFRRWWLVIVVLASLSGIVSSAAHAHSKINSHRWYFGGSTFGEAGSKSKVDPVNMFFGSAATKDEVDGHFDDHWGPGKPDEWLEDQDLPGGLKCKGDQFVRFRVPGGFPWRATDFHGAGAGRSQGRCFNRYHIRFWGDAFHEAQTAANHSARQAWVIGGAHYEANFRDGIGHVPALDWDVVESRVVKIMRPHAYRLRWRCLPHSFGLYQGYRSDGRISRLSMNHSAGVIDYGVGKC